MTVQQLLANTTSLELTEWMAHLSMRDEPRQQTDDENEQALLALAARSKKKRGKS